MGSDRMIIFEESNFDSLVEKFLKTKEVANLWADFVYGEYQDSLGDFPDGENR